MDRQTFDRSFSQPVRCSLYPPPPYLYRGVEDCFVVYEADPDGVAALLPPGVLAAGETPTCVAWARWVPFSTFGPYHEAYVMIRASLDGETYLYQPFIFTDNEVPLAAGREIGVTRRSSRSCGATGPDRVTVRRADAVHRRASGGPADHGGFDGL